MRLNVISRINADKDFFSTYLKVVAELKKSDINCQLKFIGAITCENTYNKILDNVVSDDIAELVSFTKKSVPMSEWTNDADDYYLNVCLGDFVGYSSIDCVKDNFKALFVNVANYTIDEFADFLTFCSNENDLFNVLQKIHLDKEAINKIIEQENRSLLQSFYLLNNDEELLLNMLKGETF